jgi:hypothetical protein
VKLALYKGPGKTLLHKALHNIICRVTQSQYSHCELVIGGVCYTSSNRDGGVRAKAMTLNAGQWDVYEIEGDEAKALKWFQEHMGQGYDWFGTLKFIFPFIPNGKKTWFCSEACAAALGVADPGMVSPQDLLDELIEQKAGQTGHMENKHG